MNEEKYFHIKKELLGTRKIFPFQIYIFDPITKTHSSFQKANSPLTKANIKKLGELLQTGNSIAISDKQRITFQRTLNLHKDDPIFKSPVSEKVKIEIIKSNNSVTETAPKTVSSKLVTSDFTQEQINSALQNQNYLILIEQAEKELTQFSLTDSQTTSLCVHLANKFLNKDTSLNRVVSISYFFAKALNIGDETRLATLVCAGFFSQIGMMSMAIRHSRMSQADLNKDEKETYKKYPSLSLHLCKKAQMEITPVFSEILLDHQERLSGLGIPNGKSGDELSDQSLIIGFVYHIIEYNNKNLNLLDFIQLNREYLLTEFGEKIVSNFLEMLNTSTFKKAA